MKIMLSLFFEKWNVKSKCFETEIEKWKFWKFFNISRETRFFNKIILWEPKNPDIQGVPKKRTFRIIIRVDRQSRTCKTKQYNPFLFPQGFLGEAEVVFFVLTLCLPLPRTPIKKSPRGLYLSKFNQIIRVSQFKYLSLLVEEESRFQYILWAVNIWADVMLFVGHSCLLGWKPKKNWLGLRLVPYFGKLPHESPQKIWKSGN